MENYKILFTDVHKAELLPAGIDAVGDNDVLVKTDYTVVSGGTERACILGLPNTPRKYPMALGYCGVGYVVETGVAVKKVVPGDRVLVYHGCHQRYNVRGQEEITKVENEDVSSLEAAFVIIASMGLGGVRKLELELGESAMVMGQGLLGMFATQFLHLSGANPVIAVDRNPARRELALKLGADYALDPGEERFTERVMSVTKGKGVRATVEVTGNSKAMYQALDCAAWMGRIALLGCTRVSEGTIDFYQQVHRPGVKLIGAHNFVRPKVDSYPHHWTHHDDCCAILDLISAGKLRVMPMISRVESPKNAPAIYDQLCDDPFFPIGTVFDWREIGE